MSQDIKPIHRGTLEVGKAAFSLLGRGQESFCGSSRAAKAPLLPCLCPSLLASASKTAMQGNNKQKENGKRNGPYKVNERERIPQTNKKGKRCKNSLTDVGEILSHAGQEEENVCGEGSLRNSYVQCEFLC